MLKKIYVVTTVCMMLMVQIVSATVLGVELSPGAQLYTEDGVLVDINLTFQDPQLYSENVYLSYRILDETGEILVSENPRTPIKLKEDGTAFVTVEISCADLPELQGVSVAKIQFDLVDQANEYWFSDQGLLHWTGDEVCFDRSLLGTGLVPMGNTNASEEENISDDTASTEKRDFDPVVVVLNILVWGGIILVALKKVMRNKRR